MQPSDWLPQTTQDGSFTFFSSEFGESFHSSQGAKSEAFQKFVQATHLIEKAQQPHIKLLDVCYGLGYNTAAALETIWQVNPTCQVEWYGLEIDATVPIGAIDLLTIWTPEIQAILTSLAYDHRCQTPLLNAQLLIGDARQTIQILHQAQFQADGIFFDPFSPRRCPQLWTVEFFRAIAPHLAPTGILATYSRAAATRSALLSAGFSIGTIPFTEKQNVSHEWSQGTVAAFESSIESSIHPLSQMEQEHLQTRAAVPYRDPNLEDSAMVIMQRHQAEQEESPLESTSSWRRRWGIR
jgi:tRNA U34 5-methylaminomethyl-2-thiouridine-forming methyltransferase MnmC